MAGAPPSAPAGGVDDGARGLRALAPALRQVQWPPKFKSEMPPRYDGAADLTTFLLAYEEAVLEAGGDDKVMANWLPMALASEPCAWLLNLPGSMVAPWEELRDLFTARYAVPAHHVVAALLGHARAGGSDGVIFRVEGQVGLGCHPTRGSSLPREDGADPAKERLGVAV